MATFYVRYRKKGPTGVYSVIAASKEAAIILVTKSGVAGDEFDILDTNTSGYEIASVTGPTGP